MAHLAISLLGQFEVALDGKALTQLGTDKARALLAYLAVEMEHPHHREMLAGLLWPEYPEAAAHHNLSQALLMLRRAFGEKAASLPEAPPPFLLASGKTLQLNPLSNITLDVTVFQAGVALCTNYGPEQLSQANAQILTQAIARYRGGFLSIPLQVNSVAFEEWLLFKRTQLHLLAVDALGYLVQYHELRDELDLAIGYARQQIALEPLREQAHRQLMQVLALTGRRSEALAHYGACQELLAQELGIAPAAETTALAEMIRNERLEAPKLTRTPGPKFTPVRQRISATPFVGRVHELERLDAYLAAALEGQGQVVFITGEAGSGKTTLLTAFAQRALMAHPNLLVVNSSGNAYTGLGEPYWLFIEILRQVSTGGENTTVLTSMQAQRLKTVCTLLFPGLAKALPHLEYLTSRGQQRPDNTSEIESAGVLDPITQAFQAITTQHPLAILLDDLQWADQNSLNLLFHLCRQLPRQRMLILGAFRPDVFKQGYAPLTYLHEQEVERRHPLTTLVNELQRQRGNIRIDLTQAEGRAFIAALVDSEPNHLGTGFRETLYHHTGGHALFTTELLLGMQARGDLVRDAQGYWVEGEQIAWNALPARVEAVIAERVGQLLPALQAILALASVEGEEFTVQVMARVHNLPETEISRLLSAELTRRQHLVVPLGVYAVGTHNLARYRFRHLLFQRYLYNQLDPVERAQTHLAVARALESLYSAHVAEISLPLARHFELGGEYHKAITYLLTAGQRAIRLAASEEALRLLAHGLALLNRLEPTPERAQQEADLQLTLGVALLSKGWSAPERAQAFQRAYELCWRAGAPEQLTRSLLMLADIALGRGQLDQVMVIAERLRDLSQSTRDSQVTLFMEYTLGSRHFAMGQLLPARLHLEHAIALCERYPSLSNVLPEININVRSRIWLTEVLWMLGYADQALTCSQQAVAEARAMNHTISLGLALSTGELTCRQLRREPQAMRTLLQQLKTLGNDAGLSVSQIWARLSQGWLSAVEEHDASGVSRIQEVLNWWESTDTLGGSVYGYVLLGEAYLALGQGRHALEILEQSLTQKVTKAGLHLFEAEVLRLMGEALQMLGQPLEAEACFLRAITVAQGQSAKAWELRALLSLCRLRQAKGSFAEFETARQQLVNLYAWFREGLDTHDLREAAMLIQRASTVDAP